MIRKNLLATVSAAAIVFSALPAQSAEKINFILNWVAGGDHAPVYWAKARGLYEKAGIDLTIEQGKGPHYRLSASASEKTSLVLRILVRRL